MSIVRMCVQECAISAADSVLFVYTENYTTVLVIALPQIRAQ